MLEEKGIKEKKKCKKYIRTIKEYILILIIGVALATFSIIAVNILPVDRMQAHLKESAIVMEQEDDYPKLIPEEPGTTLDNFTDSIMLVTSAFERDTSLIDQSMYAYRVLYEDARPTDVLVKYGNGEKGYTKISYARYWHGYQLFLKPLLLVFNYQEIRVINAVLVMLVFAFVISSMQKRKLQKYILPYLIAIGSMMPFSICLSLQFSTVFYIGNAGACIMMVLNEKWKIDKSKIFFVLGMCTSFFDFLTYPIFALGVPMIFYLLVRNEKGFWRNTWQVVKNSIIWGVGYAGMWCSKWLISSVLLGKNIVREAIDQIFVRTQSEVSDIEVTARQVIEKNFDMLTSDAFNKLFIILLLIGILIVIIYTVRARRNCFGQFHYFIIAVMPLCWYFVLKNHSYIHHWFTFRGLAVLIFALGVWIMKNIDDAQKVLKIKYVQKEIKTNG